MRFRIKPGSVSVTFHHENPEPPPALNEISGTQYSSGADATWADTDIRATYVYHPADGVHLCDEVRDGQVRGGRYDGLPFTPRKDTP